MIIKVDTNEITDNDPEDFITIEFDDNGPFFSDIISNKPIPVMIQKVNSGAELFGATASDILVARQRCYMMRGFLL